MTEHASWERVRIARGHARAARRRERADPAQRRTRPTATGDAVGTDRRGLPVRNGLGNASPADLFGGRSQLLVYHFMVSDPTTARGCPAYAAIAAYRRDRRRAAASETHGGHSAATATTRPLVTADAAVSG
jgi:predicted dithiol-disulfide oxidoreductase (DUF899 family)